MTRLTGDTARVKWNNGIVYSAGNVNLEVFDGSSYNFPNPGAVQHSVTELDLDYSDSGSGLVIAGNPWRMNSSGSWRPTGVTITVPESGLIA